MKTVVPYGLLTLLLLTLPGWADSEEVRTFTVVTPTVRLEKIVPARTFVGDEFPVEIHVKGLVDAADVVIQDVLPEGTSYLRSEPVGSLEGTSLNWTIRSITAGEKQVIRFVLRAERGGILSACTPMTASRHCCAVAISTWRWGASRSLLWESHLKRRLLTAASVMTAVAPIAVVWTIRTSMGCQRERFLDDSCIWLAVAL